MRTCTCPNCGANLNFDDSQKEYAFCQYCGTKIMLDDYRTVNVQRVIDEARLQEDETKRMIQMKELELREKEQQLEAQERERSRRDTYIVYGVALAISTISALLYLLGEDAFSSGIVLGLYIAIFNFFRSRRRNKKKR